MLYWNGPNRAPGLAAASLFVRCLCTSLVLHLVCVSFERHVNAVCAVQMKLSFFAGMAVSTTAPNPSHIHGGSEGPGASWRLSARVV